MSKYCFIPQLERPESKLREIARRKERLEMSLAEARARARAHGEGEGAKMSPAEEYWWCYTWFHTWGYVKAKAMRAPIKRRVGFGQSWAEFWAETWTREEERLWARANKARGGISALVEARGKSLVRNKGLVRMAVVAEGLVEAVAAGKLALVPPEHKAWAEAQAEARAQMYAEALALADALALAGVWVWAWLDHEGERVPSGLADSPTIRRILSSCHRHHHPPPRDNSAIYSRVIYLICPVTRLPFELLHQIFLIIIDESSGPPLALMLVCQRWHAIVTSILASLNLGTRTPLDAVTKKLETTQWLDIVVDTDSDHSDFTPSDGDFEAIFAAIQASSQWRSLVVESFPTQADLPANLVNRRLQRSRNVAMIRITIFKIKSACEASPLHGLLRILGTTARELTTVEINSASVVSFLTPAYSSIFHSVKVLSLDTPRMPNPVDLLPHLHQLETLTASHISFPTYHNDVDLPFVHTLRHLSLRAASIQWMSGRTFPVLEDCVLILPLHRQVLHTFTTTLPNCKQLIFQGSPLKKLMGTSAHKLTQLTVTCSGSFNGRGDQQLIQLSRHILGESRLAPRILHIGITATNRAWINALVFMSVLEELIIRSAHPSSLGAKVLQSLVVQPVNPRHLGAKSPHGSSVAPLCPSLRRFGLKYDRWLRPSEQFDLIPVFESIIESRRHSKCPLESFRLWTTSDEKNPLELIGS